MGAPDLARLQRELGAPLRIFRAHGETPAVVVALQWFARTSGGPAPVRAIPLEMGPGPASAEHRAQTQATHAAMLLAMQGLKHAQPRPGGRQALVVEWATGAWRSDEDMAQDEGFPGAGSLRTAMRWTLRCLHERMLARGLLR